MSRLRRWAAVLSTVIISSVAPAAHAQDAADVAARRDLLTQAQQAREAGDHARALDLANRAGEIGMSPSVRMFIAQEQGALNQVTLALGNAELCQREAEHDPTLRNRDTIIATCRELADGLQARVGRLTVNVPGTAPADLRVTVEGNVLNHAVYGVPSVVTPGDVLVEATGTGVEPFRQTVPIRAGQTGEVTLTLRAAATPTATSSASPAPMPTTTVAASPAPATHPPAQPTTASSSSGGGSIIGPVAVLGVGVVGLVVGAVFFVMRNDAINHFESTYCNGPDNLYCDNTPEARQALDTASTRNTVADIGFGVGAVALAAGATWLVVHVMGSGGHSEHAQLRLAPTPGGVLIGIGGSL